jgi:hypothetical protein
MKRTASSPLFDITVTTKSARTDEVPTSCFSDCPDLMIALVRVCVSSSSDQNDFIWPWRQVSKAAYASVVYVVREILQPRLRALEVALAAWKDAPLATHFPFPEPRGPLPLGRVELCQFGNRQGARPGGAVPNETAWFRPLFVWAISYVLFSDGRVNLDKAISDANKAASDTYRLDSEPAFHYFTCKYVDWEETKHPYHLKWSRAGEHSPQALLSTFSTGRYENSLDMAIFTGNRQRFTRALLDQMNGFVPAIAFLLFWAQHVTFATWVNDLKFLCALQVLAGELAIEWRCIETRNTGLYYEWYFFQLWFGDRPDTLVYNPVYLDYPLDKNKLRRAENKREAIQNFAIPEHRQCLIEKAMRTFDRLVNNAFVYIVSRQ